MNWKVYIPLSIKIGFPSLPSAQFPFCSIRAKYPSTLQRVDIVVRNTFPPTSSSTTPLSIVRTKFVAMKWISGMDIVWIQIHGKGYQMWSTAFWNSLPTLNDQVHLFPLHQSVLIFCYVRGSRKGRPVQIKQRPRVFDRLIEGLLWSVQQCDYEWIICLTNIHFLPLN